MGATNRDATLSGLRFKTKDRVGSQGFKANPGLELANAFSVRKRLRGKDHAPGNTPLSVPNLQYLTSYLISVIYLRRHLVDLVKGRFTH